MLWYGKNFEFKASKIPYKFYVYALFINDGENPIYIGKGSGSRARGHLTNPANKALSKVLKKHNEYYIGILNGTSNESVAYHLESVYIQKYKKKIDGGLLLNFTDGGKDFSSHTKNERFKKQKSKEYSEKFGKSIFIDGFIFPSKRVAERATKIGRGNFNYLLKIGRAFLIDDHCLENHKKYEIYLKNETIKYLEIKNRDAKIKTQKPICFKNKVYPSVKDAANEVGRTSGLIVWYLKNNKHQDCYYLEL